MVKFLRVGFSSEKFPKREAFMRGLMSLLHRFGCFLLLAGVAAAQTNIAPSGTGYTWHTMATATATSNQTAAAGVNNGNLTVGVNADAAGDSANQYEGGGVIFASAQSNITKVDFINGTTDANGNGFFEGNVTLQTYNGSAWSNVSGWTVSPTYPNTTAASGLTYTFTGAALNNVSGVRVVGQVRVAGNSWSWIVNEVRVYATSSADFTLSASPASQTVTAGNSTSYTAIVSALNGFNSAVVQTVSGLPSGASASFNPTSISGGAGSSTLTVNTGTAAAGTYTLTLTGTSGSLSHNATVTLVINTSGTLTNIAPNATGYTWHTMATATATTNQTAAPGVNNGNLTVGVNADPTGESANQYEGGGVIFASAQNNITKVDFINGTTTSGGDGFFEANLTLQTYNGSAWSNVSGWTVSPAYPNTTAASGVTYSFTGPALNNVSGVRVVGQVRVAGNSWEWIVNEVRVYASSGQVSPDFALSASPASRTVTPGSSTSFAATTTALNAFTGTVSLSVSGLPSGVTAAFSPASVTGSGTSTVTVTTASTTPLGTYTLTVSGVSGSLSHTATVSLVVSAAPDFMLSASPSSQTVAAGSGTSYTPTVGALNGFNGSVTFSVSGLPTGAMGSFSPTSVTGAASSTLTVSTATSTPVGTYTLTVTGVSGSLSHSAVATLVVNAAGTGNFTIAVSPATKTVAAGNTASYTTTIAATGGFTGTVALSATGLPTGSSGSFSPASVAGSGSSTLNVTTASTLAAGSYAFTLTGVSGSLSHSTTATLTVTANTGGTISWMGHSWDITPSGTPIGGAETGNTATCKSDPANISVDANGFLHLKITSAGTGSEMFTHDFLGFGTYQWQIQGNNIYNMDPQVVLGPFTYGPQAGIGVDGENELDMEWSKWDGTVGNNTFDFTFYPSTGNGGLGASFFSQQPLAATASGFTTARLHWGSTQVAGTIMDGLQPIGTTANVTYTQTFNGNTTTVPQDAVPLGVNLWCFGPKPAHNWEIIIQSFQFAP